MLAPFVALRISKLYSITIQVRRSHSELLSQQKHTLVSTVSQILSGLCVSHVCTWPKPVHQWRNIALRARRTLWLKWSGVPSWRNTTAVYFSRRILQFAGMEPVLIFRGKCFRRGLLCRKEKGTTTISKRSPKHTFAVGMSHIL